MRTHRWCTRCPPRCPLIHQYKVHGYAPSVRTAISWQEHSFGPAAAGVVIAKKASAKSAVAGAALILTSCFILLSLCRHLPQSRHVMSEAGAPWASKKSNLILFRALERIETHCAAAILKNDNRHSLGNRALFSWVGPYTPEVRTLLKRSRTQPWPPEADSARQIAQPP